MSGKHPLMIRADAGRQTGLGHVTRCLAFAQAWRDIGRTVVMATRAPSEPLLSKWREEGLEVECLTVEPGGLEDAKATMHAAERCEAKWVMMDGYFFDWRYQKHLKASGLRTCLVDDYGHASHYCADVIINQNVYARQQLYEKMEPRAELLLGPRFVMLRREFREWRGWKRPIPRHARKLLVTLGGADLENVTSKVLESLRGITRRGLESVVVLGVFNSHYENLADIAQGSSHPVTLMRSTQDMPGLMAWADLAISAGGSTCYEIAYMQLPCLTVVLAENQCAVAKGLGDLGVLTDLGWHEGLSPAEIRDAVERLLQDEVERSSMALRGRSVVDGRGAKRIRNAFVEKEIELRQVTHEDCGLLWDWVNDPTVRRVSFASEMIGWDEHQRWFEAKTKDRNCVIQIALNDERNAIGQARFEKNSEETVVSVTLDKKFRGCGYAESLIDKASRQAFDLFETDAIHAYIKVDNQASLCAFEGAGYRDAGVRLVKGVPSRHFILSRGGKDAERI